MRRLLLLLPLLLLPPAVPATAPAVTTSAKHFTVDVTAIHVVEWSYRTAGYPETCKGWTNATGRQTAGFSTPRPMRYKAILNKGGERFGLPPAVFLPKRVRPAKATVARTHHWQDHIVPATTECTGCGPSSEYGECKATPQPEPMATDCKRRKLTGTIAGQYLFPDLTDDTRPEHAVAFKTLRVTLPTGAASAFPRCYPNLGGGPWLHAPDPEPVDIVGRKVDRLLKLRKGAKLTLKHSDERGFSAAGSGSTGTETTRCTTPAGAVGYQECAVTDVTVEVERIK